MRLKTQSHLITVALTGLIVWQFAKATQSAPTASAPAPVATPRDAEDKPRPSAAPQVTGPERRVRREVPSVRSSFVLDDGGVTVTVEPDQSGSVRVRDLVAQLASALATSYTLDAQAADVRLTVGGEPTLSRQRLREVLRSAEVCLAMDSAGGLHAYHVRNATQLAPPPTQVVADGAAVDPDQLINRVVPVYHGSGNAIFATLRGLACRDTARVSNVLYVPGSETLVISDFACNVRDYERLIEALDVPLAELAPGE